MQGLSGLLPMAHSGVPTDLGLRQMVGARGSDLERDRFLESLLPSYRGRSPRGLPLSFLPGEMGGTPTSSPSSGLMGGLPENWWADLIAELSRFSTDLASQLQGASTGFASQMSGLGGALGGMLSSASPVVAGGMTKPVGKPAWSGKPAWRRAAPMTKPGGKGSWASPPWMR